MSVKTPAQTEKQFQAALVQYAKLNGWMVFHPFDSRRSEPGWPDLTLVRRERLIFAELKTDRGKTSPEQDRWLDTLRTVAFGVQRLTGSWLVRVVLWRPADWQLIERELARVGGES